MSDAAPLVWLIAGEPSGDLIGARLMIALRARTGGAVRFEGVGGPAMSEEGLTSLFPITDIALMGLVEVVPRLLAVRRRQRETTEAILAAKPDVVVSIDAPGFCFGVWKGLRGSDIPLVHYVAPTVWAWRPRRAEKFAAEIDHLMALLPFEPPYFEKEGLACTFVGHPVLEGGADSGDRAGFRLQHGIDADATVVGMMPGSRHGELRRLLPVFREAVDVLVANRSDFVVVVPAVPYLGDVVRDAMAGWPVPVIVVDRLAGKFDAMAACDVALAASGTVSLELAMAGAPHAITYRMNRLTIAIFRLLRGAKSRYANLVNVLLDREAVPELLQERCRGDLLAAEALRLLDDADATAAQRAAFGEALAMLRPEGGSPSTRAADVVLSCVERGVAN